MYIVTYLSHNPTTKDKKFYWKADAESGVTDSKDATRIFDNQDAKAIAYQYMNGDIEQVA